MAIQQMKERTPVVTKNWASEEKLPIKWNTVNPLVQFTVLVTYSNLKVN